MEKIWKCQSVPIWQMSQKNVKNGEFCHTIYYQQGIHHSHVNQQPVKTSEILAWNLVCTLFFLGTYHSGPQQRIKSGRGMNERKHKKRLLISTEWQSGAWQSRAGHFIMAKKVDASTANIMKEGSARLFIW